MDHHDQSVVCVLFKSSLSFLGTLALDQSVVYVPMSDSHFIDSMI